MDWITCSSAHENTVDICQSLYNDTLISIPQAFILKYQEVASPTSYQSCAETYSLLRIEGHESTKLIVTMT